MATNETFLPTAGVPWVRAKRVPRTHAARHWHGALAALEVLVSVCEVWAWLEMAASLAGVIIAGTVIARLVYQIIEEHA